MFPFNCFITIIITSSLYYYNHNLFSNALKVDENELPPSKHRSTTITGLYSRNNDYISTMILIACSQSIMFRERECASV